MKKLNDTTYEKVGDSRKAIVGGNDESKFIPNINISCWDDECFLNLNFEQIPMAGIEPVIEDDGDDLEAGVRLLQPVALDELVLRVLHSEGLAFHYQGALTQEEIDDGHKRPTKVVGSFAVYHDKSNGKYKTGKVAHLYRWKCTDADGNIEWCEPLRLENDKLIIGLPTEWLKTAVYPVYVGSPATIGFTSIGASTKDNSNFAYAWEITMTEDGDLTDIDCYGVSGAADNVTFGIFDDDGAASIPGTLLKDTGGGATTTTPGWWSQSLDSTLSLSNADRVFLVSHNDTSWTQYYDSVVSPADLTYRVSAGTYNSGDLSSLPTGWSINSPGANYYKWSWYATYTPTANPTVTDVNLVDLTGTAQASLSSLRWSWFDSTTPSSFSAPVNQGTAESTDGSGNITLDLTSSVLTTGQEGTLVLSNSGGTIIGAYRLAVD